MNTKNFKFIIVGFHGSGKMHVADRLREYGASVGNIFRSTESVGQQYTLSTVVYDTKEINNIFDTQSYIFMKECRDRSNKYYEGISFYEYQNNDVFVISPDQFNNIPKFDDNVVFVWLDNSSGQRRARYRSERRKYDFVERDNMEYEFVQDFTDRMGDNPVMYFYNEDPDRVATILWAILQHPDLLDSFLNTFN
jgi:hypothetical protein